MSYTFDEAFKQVDDNAFKQWYELLEKLKQEYAPIIEMTKKQYNYIIHLIQQGKELGATFIEFWAGLAHINIIGVSQCGEILVIKSEH